MARTINVHRDFYRSLLPLKVELDRVVNPEPVLQYFNCQPALGQQNLIELRADLELPELCDSKDVAIAILAGRGSLILNQEVVSLEPEIVVFIPAQTLYKLWTQTDLMLLLSRSKPDPVANESAWIVNL